MLRWFGHVHMWSREEPEVSRPIAGGYGQNPMHLLFSSFGSPFTKPLHLDHPNLILENRNQMHFKCGSN